MKLRTHRNNVYLLRSLDSSGIISSRSDKRLRGPAGLDPDDLALVRRRLDGLLTEPIFLSLDGQAAFLIPSAYPVCGMLELITLELAAQRLLPSVKNGFFGTVVYSSRLGALDADGKLTADERDMANDVARHIRSLMRSRGVAEAVGALSQAERVTELIAVTADFFGVDIEVTSSPMSGLIENCDRDLISAFAVSALMLVRRTSKRRSGAVRLSSASSRLWLMLEADCLDGSVLDELEPLRQSTRLRGECLRVANERGRIRVELCAYRPDASLLGLKQDPELIC